VKIIKQNNVHVADKKINSKLSLSISSGGRPTNSRQLAKRSKTISAFDVPQTPTNLVLIHDTEERVHNSPPLTETVSASVIAIEL